jgi:SAM-dependent methyltransferase
LLESYEAVPYDSKPVHFSHIARVEAIARLYGLAPEPATRCRVLELGCASGGNLIPMAASFPDSHFVGLDLAPSQVAVGQDDIRSLGFTNIALHAMDVTNVTRELGEFDYIICHGIYSWVPPEVQQAILRVCSENLTPNGIAYVSYNVFPGWHLRGVARDLLVGNDDHSLPAIERIARARALIASVLADVAEPTSMYEAIVRDEFVTLRDMSGPYLLHEELAPFNAPLYFTEFAQRAAAAGLTYVGDARIESNVDRSRWSSRLEPAANDRVIAEQALDHARGTSFRRSLLCHDTLTPVATPKADVIQSLHVSTRSVPATPSDDDLKRSQGLAESFRSHDGVTITTNNPMVVGAFRVLLQVAPAGLSFAELARRIADRMRVTAPPGFESTSDPVDGLDAALLQCALGGMIELLAYEEPIAPAVSERPIVRPVARWNALHGRPVPNLRHFPVTIGGVDRLLLIHLDGTRTRGELVSLATRAMIEEGLATDESKLQVLVDESLQKLANTALLAC